jgi:hypothetical protein
MRARPTCEDAAVELLPSRIAQVGRTEVRRALPQRGRRTVGAWCFADHFGPTEAADGMAIGPHPHIGLHTVTWLVDGGLLHKDGLGSEQPIRPGQLNLMTAGHGIAHAEESLWKGHVGTIHGIQLWVAQPDATRDGPAAFEHHDDLPTVEVGFLEATVLIGTLEGVHSPARQDTPLLGAELRAYRGETTLELDPTFEHALVVLDGVVTVEDDTQDVATGALAFLGAGRDELTLAAEEDARLMLLGGPPFEADPWMSWNFVARTPEEVRQAATDWNAGDDGRFGPVASDLPRIPAP